MQTTSQNFSQKISCIYINYRSKKLLLESLQSLIHFETSSCIEEVIVINNDQEEILEFREENFPFPVRVIAAEKNIGFAAAANLAAATACGQALFFVNPDTLWRKPILEEGLKILQKPRAGILGFGLCSNMGVLELKNGGNFLTPQSLFYSIKNKEIHQESVLHEVEWVSGGALMVPRDIFLSVGGFDERFFMYFEDMDLCKRVKELGYHIFLNQSLYVTHLSGKSHQSKKSQKTLYDASLSLYVQKHWSGIASALFLFLHRVYRFFYPYGR